MAGLDYDELFPGRFLKSGEFKGRDVTLTVAGVRIEELPQDKGGLRAKGILSFRETKKELVLNRTNGECIKAMFGRDTGAWIGKRITFWPAPFTSSFGDEPGTAIRVRGSPDLEHDMRIEVRLPRKKPIPVTMKATGKKAAPTNGKGAPPSRPPPPEPEPVNDANEEPPPGASEDDPTLEALLPT